VPAALSAGLRVQVEVTQEKVVYSFRSHIVGVGEEEGGAMHVVLSAPDALEERENARQNFRVTFLGDGVVVPLRGLADRRPRTGQSIPAIMVDLSASGVAVRLPEDQAQEVAQVLRLRLPLAGTARDELVGEVVHVRDGPDGTIIHGCRFLEPTAALQRDLQAAVFKLQIREMSLRREEQEGGGEQPTEATTVVAAVSPKRRI
jgi:c-di-GMP-binding flagellar brake protein YcgR